MDFSRYDDQYQLQLVHATPIDAVPTYLFPFEGRLLVAAGRTLRIYELGKRKLLRKCEYRGIPEGFRAGCFLGRGAAEGVRSRTPGCKADARWHGWCGPGTPADPENP